MAIVAAWSDVEYLVCDAVAQGGGTSTAGIVIPSATTSSTDCYVVGTSLGAASFYQKVSCTVNVDGSGNTSFAMPAPGNTNPANAATTDICSDPAFSDGSTPAVPSSVAMSVSSGGNLTCTVTNNSSTQDNDYVVIFDSFWVVNG